MMPAIESKATLAAQQKQLVDGHRRAQLFPKGHLELKVPKGMGRIKTKNGDVWHFNPKKVKASQIVKASNAGRENDILDLGPVTKEEAVQRAAGGEVPVAVVERDENGTEVRGSAATDKTAHAQMAVIERAKSPEHTVGIENPEDVIKGRYASGGNVDGPEAWGDKPADGPEAWGDTLAAPSREEPISTNNVVRAAATGVPILGGLMNRANAATNATLAPVLNPLFDKADQLPEENWSERYAHSLRDQEGIDKRFQEQHPVVNAGAQLAGGIAATLPVGATAIGARALGIEGGNIASRIGLSTATNSAIGATDAAIRGEDVGSGASIGAVGGALGPVASSAIERVARPIAQSPARMAMVNVLRREGVEPTAGQASGSKPLRYAESALGDAPLAGGRTADLMEQQAEAFTRAALRRAGTDAPRATPEVMQETADRIGAEFERLSSGNTMRLDAPFGRDIGRVLNEYDRVLPSQQREVVQNVVDDILAHGTRMPGEVYQEARSRLSRLAHNTRQNDPTFSEALAGIRDALDNAMGRSITGEDRAAWNLARRQWGNYRTIEKAVTGAGENAAMGLISPAQLRSATAVRNRSAYAQGRGDLAELARAGTAILNPLPNSGTAQRNLINHIMASAAGAGVGGAAGQAHGDGFLPGAIAGAVAPGLAGRALLSRPTQAYLTNGLGGLGAVELSRALGAVGAPTLARRLYVGPARLPYPSDGQ